MESKKHSELVTLVVVDHMFRPTVRLIEGLVTAVGLSEQPILAASAMVGAIDQLERSLAGKGLYRELKNAPGDWFEGNRDLESFITETFDDADGGQTRRVAMRALAEKMARPGVGRVHIAEEPFDDSLFDKEHRGDLFVFVFRKTNKRHPRPDIAALEDRLNPGREPDPHAVISDVCTSEEWQRIRENRRSSPPHVLRL